MSLDVIAKTKFRAGVLRQLHREIVLTSPEIISGAAEDTNPEALVAGAEVQIDTIGDVSSGDYDDSTDLSVELEELAASKTIVKLDQQKFAGYNLESTSEIRIQQKLMDPQTQEAVGRTLREQIEEYIASLHVEAGVGPGTEGAPISVATATDFYDDIIVPLGAQLSKNNVPKQGRFCVISPDLKAKLQVDSRLIGTGAMDAEDRLKTGLITKVGGFDLYESNALAETSPGVGIKLLAGHRSGWGMAQNVDPDSVRVIPREKRMGWQVAALAVFGAKVLDSSRVLRAVVSI